MDIEMLCVVRQCVKALVYYDVQTCRLDLQNDKGDTPLHMAARWGYEGIIQVLLENGACTDILNKNKESPLQCALNSKVSNWFNNKLFCKGHTTLSLYLFYFCYCFVINVEPQKEARCTETASLT